MMSSANQTISTWMIDDKLKTKVKIKYELKQKELLLRQLFQEGMLVGEYTDLILLLKEISSLYQVYLDSITFGSHIDIGMHHVSSIKEALTLYKSVQSLVQGYIFDASMNSELNDIPLILACYQSIALFLSSSKEASYLSDANISAELQKILALLDHPLDKNWYLLFIQYMNHAAKSTEVTRELDLLNTGTLRRLWSMYSSDWGIKVFNLLFYYRHYPEQLLSQVSSDLVDLYESRLFLLYDFYLSFKNQIKACLLIKEREEIVDYLLDDPVSLSSKVGVKENEALRHMLLLALTESMNLDLTQAAFKKMNFYHILLKSEDRHYSQNLLQQFIFFLKQWEESCALTVKDSSYPVFLSEALTTLTTDQCCRLYHFLTNEENSDLLQFLKQVSNNQNMNAQLACSLDTCILAADIREKLLESIALLYSILTKRHLLVVKFVEREAHLQMPLSPKYQALLQWLSSLSDDKAQQVGNAHKINHLFNLLETHYPLA